MQNLHQTVLKASGAKAIRAQDALQQLWSGYGTLWRFHLEGGSVDSVIVKEIDLKPKHNHPRGWSGDIGHQRKLKSYQVEQHWYAQYAGRSKARIPRCLAIHAEEENLLLILEDLDPAGYPLRKQSLGWPKMQSCLKWLAQFHASYIGATKEGLWPTGSYWHLETRPQELDALKDTKLKWAAPYIDQKLKEARYQCLVHGDAKLANFCFGEDGAVAAVDFQYVGGGCGMKDLAYFVGSCLYEEDCERLEGPILDAYFAALQEALPQSNADLEKEWRELYPYAWADFHRFLKGWSPGHWKINSYSEKVTAAVINELENEF